MAGMLGVLLRRQSLEPFRLQCLWVARSGAPLQGFDPGFRELLVQSIVGF